MKWKNYFIINKLNKMTFQILYNYIGTPVSGCVALLVGHYLKLRRIKLFKKKSDPVMESVKNNILIEFKVEQILTDYDADRAYIIQFHNGGNIYPSGKSIPKFSVFYENVKPGMCGIRDKFQNIPVSIFGKFFNYLAEKDITCFTDIRKSTVEDVELKGLTRDTDARSSYIVAIKSIDNKFMGVLAIDYIKKKRFLSEDKIKDLQNNATSIAGELSKHQIVK